MMKPIILASESKARKSLLKSLGVKFRVMVPCVRESACGRAPEKTAMANALLKARDVAKRVASGVVIGCDTFVSQDGRVYGKPKDIKDARAMLKKLSSCPHTLYSGIAVIDRESGCEFVECEKTKIFMESLSDGAIAKYFHSASPFGKAGSFDIQGSGGKLVRRIEGCYFNVVGLPLSRLFRLLKKAGVFLSLFACFTALSGCATEFNAGTGTQDVMMYSTDREGAIGDSIARQVEKDYTVIHDRELNERLNRVKERIVAACDRHDVLYRFRIIEDKKDPEVVNAVSLPGGYVYVFKDLMKMADSDDELAAVLAHEVGHIVGRHSMKLLQAEWGYNILTIVSVATKSAQVAGGAQLAYMHILMGYSQEMEMEADQMGARYAKRAGYNPDGMISFLKKLEKKNKKEKARPLSYFRTHPYTASRIKAVKMELGEEIGFEDYLNSQ